MQKYLDVDILKSMSEIVKNQTAFYQSDFTIDKSRLLKDIIEQKKKNPLYMWLVRPSGTQMLALADVLTKESAAYNTWLYYSEQEAEQKYLAFVIEPLTLIESQESIIKGNIYELDYFKSCDTVKSLAVASEIVYIYEHGTLSAEKAKSLDYDYLAYNYGDKIGTETAPLSDCQLSAAVLDFKDLIKQSKEEDIEVRISKLSEENLRFELDKIKRELKKDKKKVEVSAWYEKLGGEKGISKLAELLKVKIEKDNNAFGRVSLKKE